MSDAADVAQRFLSAVEQRDAAACKSMMAPEIEMVFPGGVHHHSIEALFASSAKRYRAVGKTITRIEAYDDGGLSIVFLAGTLHGIWLNGQAFDGVRFIDRLEIRDGLITRQEVWNDSAIYRPA